MKKEQKAQFARIDDFVRWADRLMRNPKVKYNLADVRCLTRHKRAMERGKGDPLLGKIIKADLKTIEVMEQYIIAHNAGDKVNARRYQTKLERMWGKTDRLVYAAIGRIDAYGN